MPASPTHEECGAGGESFDRRTVVPMPTSRVSRGSSRPTRPALRYRSAWKRAAAYRGRSTAKISTGRLMPFSRRSPSECRKKSASTSCWVTSLITTVPGSAACWIRAARLGTSPTIESRSATDPSCAQVGDDHPAGVDADADLGGGAELRLELGTGVTHGHDEVEAGEHGPPGVVLVRFGIAEAGEDAVAGVLHQVPLYRVTASRAQAR